MSWIKYRKALFPILIFFFLHPVVIFSATYDDVSETLSEIFDDYIDENEGTTSFRSLYIPSGGRAEALGSAFTALADDISFFEYNPAGSCQLENTEAAIFHNSWISDSSLETLSYVNRINNLGYGASLKCFYVPFTEYNIFGDNVSTGYYSETTATLNVSYNFLAGYKFKGICVGANLKGAFRSIPDYTDNDTDEIITDSGLSQSAIAAMTDIGVLLQFNALKFYSSRDSNLNFGATIHNLGFIYTDLTSSDSDFSETLPTYFSTGIAYSFIRPVTITLEYQQPFNLSDLSTSEQWAASTGTSVIITPFFTMLGGFQLRGGSPRLTMGGELKYNEVTFNINYTLDMTSSTTPINRISVTAKLNLGDNGRYELQQKIDEMYSTGLHLYANGELEKAIEIWSEILEYSPRFDPAIAGIESAQSSLELEQRIKELQTLN
ncbi:MAG: hypothetical protein BKP49_02815 [Treponema sp. CETP13]|nr:MAG: hypothetical protein BKP49_02815 [Treponema sp. CETP13]